MDTFVTNSLKFYGFTQCFTAFIRAVYSVKCISFHLLDLQAVTIFRNFLIKIKHFAKLQN